MNLNTAKWDPELCDAFGIPLSALPEITPSWGSLGRTDPDSFLGLRLEITGIAGDQQAALFGQTGFDVSDSKCTYGTGAFILTNTGEEIVLSSHGLLATVAWQEPSGRLTYASEGSVFVAGAAVQWIRDGMGLISASSEIEALAKSVPDSQGVVFVPALTGLGAPFWDADARGAVFGITRGTTSGHLARATLEGIAFQVKAVVDAMAADLGKKVSRLRVDGGAASNSLLLQIQADLINQEVIRAKNLESTGFGAALLAGLGSGIWGSMDELRLLNPVAASFSPSQDRSGDYQRFLKAVSLVSGFEK